MKPDNTPHVLAIDIGTSALKADLFNAKGRVLASSSRRYNYRVPQAGRAEADPEDWWTALVEALAELQATGLGLNVVEVVGLTGQMHTAVLLDKTGYPLKPTILWLDRRAVTETAELREQLAMPHSRLNSTYTLPKLLWLARHQPEVLTRTHTILWPKDYLRYRLTGRFLTDVTEAGGAALLDEEQLTWAIDRLKLANLEPSVLPPLRAAGDDAGPLLPKVAARLGLSPTAKVIVGAGDVIALLGAAPPRSGRLTCSLGSSAMISSLLTENQIINDPSQRLYVYPFLPYRLLNGVLSTSGASLVWARQAFYGEEVSWESMLAAAIAAPAGAEGLFFLPFLTGERSPYWDDALRGGFYGLTLSHNRAHMSRAVMEGVAYSLRHLLDIGEELGVPINQIALAGGGATVSGWPQIMADVCQRPLVIYTGQETLTKALYAYCAAALDKTVSFDQALNSTFDMQQRITPRLELASIYEPIYRQYRLMADFVAKGMS